MAKYEINYSCGHCETVQLYGPYKDRERKIKWLEQGVCPSCYKKHRAEYADQQAEKYGLPKLSGSPKQVAWAKIIRMELTDKFNEFLKGRVPLENTPGLAVIKSVTNAAYWIDNREKFFMDWLKDTKALMENESK